MSVLATTKSIEQLSPIDVRTTTGELAYRLLVPNSIGETYNLVKPSTKRLQVIRNAKSLASGYQKRFEYAVPVEDDTLVFTVCDLPVEVSTAGYSQVEFYTVWDTYNDFKAIEAVFKK